MIDLSKLTPAAKIALEKAVQCKTTCASSQGAFPQWIGSFQSVLEAVSPAAASCYGLAITSERRGIFFDPAAVSNFFGTDEIALLESYVGERVYPLGVLDCAYAFLTDTGRVIRLDRDWLFFCVYRDIYALLNWIFTQDATYIDEQREFSPSERP